MNHLHIESHDGRTSFAPGGVLAGTITWSLEAPTRAVELHLRWNTRGKGKSDSETVATLRIDDPPMQGAREFQFRVPESPFSFEGKLVSVSWQLILFAGAQRPATLDIVISPGARPVDLYALAGS